MHSVGIIIFCSSVLGALSELTSQERDAAIWASSPFQNDTSIRPFAVTFSDADIQDLRSRLSDNTRTFVPSLEGVAFEYGFNSKLIPEWRSYWANQYNFTARLQYMNQYPQYKTNIQGTDVHFVRVKPQNTDCIVHPLLILHSFPSTFLEFYKVIPLLTTCTFGISFEVIVPSIPGYGYSDPPTKVGFGAAEAATVMKNLMIRIGHNQFYLASGDITHVGAMMATLYPTHVSGFYANNLVCYSPLSWGVWVAGAWSPYLLADNTYQHKMYPLGQTIASFLAETGFVHILSTRPDAIGAAMNEAPTGMMTFITSVSQWLANNGSVYKSDGDLGIANRDELLDTVNLYWFSNSMTSAGRLYSETFNNRTYQEEIYAKKTYVPTWIVTANSSAITQAPLQYAIKYQVLLKVDYLDKYGLFLANQAPEYYAETVREAVSFMQLFHAGGYSSNSVADGTTKTSTITTCDV